jgi:penicillin-binding protein-related factor A (putative recombinase)
MPTLRKIRAGLNAKNWGRAFEQDITLAGRKANLAVIRIPDGCETRRTPKGQIIVRVRSPFDYVILKDTTAIVFDAKTTQKNSFSKSDVTEHQIQSLHYCNDHALQSGYLIWFRTLDEVAFFTVEQLKDLPRGKSLKPTDGYILGRSGAINLDALFSVDLDLD